MRLTAYIGVSAAKITNGYVLRCTTRTPTYAALVVQIDPDLLVIIIVFAQYETCPKRIAYLRANTVIVVGYIVGKGAIIGSVEPTTCR